MTLKIKKKNFKFEKRSRRKRHKIEKREIEISEILKIMTLEKEEDLKKIEENYKEKLQKWRILLKKIHKNSI